MRRLVVIAALLGSLVLSAGALGVLTPGRTVTNAAPVTALSVTGRSVVWAVGATGASCGSVRLWDTGTRGLWTFGERTIVGCTEGPSGGFGISSVSTSGRRAFWLTHIGGNTTDWQLVDRDSDAQVAAPARVRLVGHGRAGRDRPRSGDARRRARTPWAAPSRYVSDSGARLFRTTLDSPVRLLTAGTGPGTARVLASLADGRVVLLSGTGSVLRTDDYEAGTVRAIALALAGPLVQVGTTVSVGPTPGGTKVTLPPGALMLDQRQRAIVYRKGAQVRSRHIATGADTLLQVIPIRPWQPMLFSTDSWGSAWAKGRAVSWRSGPLG